MFLLPIKLDRVSFETKGRQNLQKTADFLIESIVFCPLVPPSWISLVDPTSAMYASAIYVSYIYDPVLRSLRAARLSPPQKVGLRISYGISARNRVLATVELHGLLYSHLISSVYFECNLYFDWLSQLLPKLMS